MRKYDTRRMLSPVKTTRLKGYVQCDAEKIGKLYAKRLYSEFKEDGLIDVVIHGEYESRNRRYDFRF